MMLEDADPLPFTSRDGVPHLLLVGARAEVVSKFVGLPVALTVIQQPGKDVTVDQMVALSVHLMDFTDIESLTGCMRQIHRRRRLDAVLSLTEPGLLPASIAAAEIGIRANPPSAVAATLNKATMRRLLREKGVDSTRYLRCEGLDVALRFAGNIRGPIVLKPSDGAGSVGVALARRITDVGQAWAWCRDAGSPSIMAEEYIEGSEYSVETMTAAGRHYLLAITGKYTTGPPHFIEVGHDELALITAEETQAITARVFAALDAVGHLWGPCHTEVIVSRDSASVVEINTRVGGDRIWEMVELTTGIDIVAATVRALTSDALPAPRSVCQGAAVRFLTPAPGRVRRVSGVEEARSVTGVIRVADLPRAGEIVRPLASSDDRAGYVLAAGRDAESAAAAATAGASALHIDTD